MTTNELDCLSKAPAQPFQEDPAVLFVICVLLSLGLIVHRSNGKQSETRFVLTFSVKWLAHRGGRVGY